jgi:hypothetical protein
MIDAASIASRIPETTEPRSESHDNLALAEYGKLNATGKTEYHHRIVRTELKVQIIHFKERCERFESQHVYLIQRVAELEQSERNTKAAFDLSGLALSLGGSVISFSSLFLWDSVKWLCAGLGAGMCVIGVLLLRNISKNGWPPFRPKPSDQSSSG